MNEQSSYRLAVWIACYVGYAVAIACGYRLRSGAIQPNHGGKDGTAVAYSWLAVALVQIGVLGGAFQGENVPSQAIAVYFFTSLVTIFGFIAMHVAAEDQGLEQTIRVGYFNEATRNFAFRFGLATLVGSITVVGVAATNFFPFGKDETTLPIVDALPYQIRSTTFDPGPVTITDGIQVLIAISPESYGDALPESFSVRGEFLNAAQKQWELMEASSAFIGDPTKIVGWLRNEEAAKLEAPSDEHYVEYHVQDLLHSQMGNFESRIHVVAESENPVFPSVHDTSKPTFTVLFPYGPPTETRVLQLRLAPIEGVDQTLTVSDFKEGHGLRMTYLKRSK